MDDGVGAVVTIKLLDDGHIEVELDQAEHQYQQEALTVARLALDDLLAHLVNERGKGAWSVDWPNL